MGKIDDAIAILLESNGESNAQIARILECDEGLVRRARKEILINSLFERIATLERQLASCRCNAPLPPRKMRHRPEPQRLLWEHEIDGEFTPFIPMLGEVS